MLLLTGPWQNIFLFMGGLATVISLWAFFRLPETLQPENRRPLSFKSVIGRLPHRLLTNRVGILLWPRRHVPVRGDVRLHLASQQIFVEIYGLGPYFPVAFAAMAGTMAIASVHQFADRARVSACGG